jgi:hypothetical protein
LTVCAAILSECFGETIANLCVASAGKFGLSRARAMKRNSSREPAARLANRVVRQLEHLWAKSSAMKGARRADPTPFLGCASGSSGSVQLNAVLRMKEGAIIFRGPLCDNRNCATFL